MKYLLAISLLAVVVSAGLAWQRPELVGLPERPVGPSSIVKTPGYFMEGRVESSLVLLGSRVVGVVSVHTISEGQGIIIRDLETKQDIQQIAWPYRYASAVNDGEDVLILGSKRTEDRTEVGLLRLGADLSVKEQRPLFDSPGHIANTSLIFDGKRYVLAIEVESDVGGQFHPRFMESPDLKTWSVLGVDMLPDEYAACPTIRYVDGWYYIFYLRSHKMRTRVEGQEYAFSTRLARTKDFHTFEIERYLQAPVVLAPEEGEKVNASDLDLLEHDGKVHMIYNIGNQLTPGYLRTAVYNGSLSNMVREIW